MSPTVPLSQHLQLIQTVVSVLNSQLALSLLQLPTLNPSSTWVVLDVTWCPVFLECLNNQQLMLTANRDSHLLQTMVSIFVWITGFLGQVNSASWKTSGVIWCLLCSKLSLLMSVFKVESSGCLDEYWFGVLIRWFSCTVKCYYMIGYRYKQWYV